MSTDSTVSAPTVPAKPDHPLYLAFRFFLEHADATPPGRAACALDLARAEAWGKERGIEVIWEEERERSEDVYGDPAPEGCDILHARIEHDGRVVASLGMNDIPRNASDARRERRVVEAELLCEARATIREDDERAAGHARMRRNADLATCCLTMTSVSATMPSGVRIDAYAMPRECLNTARQLRDAGADDVFVHCGMGHDYWSWFRPGKRAADRRHRRLLDSLSKSNDPTT